MAQNNSVSFTVNVIEEKINVLLIEGFPRFEFKLIKGVLEVDPLVNLVSVGHLPGGGVYVQGDPLHRNPEQGLISSQADLFKYDVVILRDVPRSYFRADGDTTESRLAVAGRVRHQARRRADGPGRPGRLSRRRLSGQPPGRSAAVRPERQISGDDQFEGTFFARFPSRPSTIRSCNCCPTRPRTANG